MSFSKHFFLPVMLCLITFFSVAQQGRDVYDHRLIKLSEKYLYGEIEEIVEGTPYLNDAYMSGEVYIGKEKYSGIPMRYNIYKDLVEFKENNTIYNLPPDPSIEVVAFDNNILLVENYYAKGKIKPGFFILLDSGRAVLMSKKVVNYINKNDIIGIPAKYARGTEIFYYKIDNGDLMEIGSIKRMITGFPDHWEELNQFAKRGKISVNRDELIKLIRYYNSL